MPPQDPKSRQEFSEGNAHFAVKIYRELASESTDNLFLSPWSISSAMAMTYAGTRSETASELASALAFTLPPARLDEAFRRASANAEASAGPNVMQLANAFWGDQNYTFLSEYQNRLRDCYGAEAINLDFGRDPEAARNRINDWVSDRTNERIRDLFPEGSIDALTRLVLTNAIYFKGKWEKPFDPRATRDEAFIRGGKGSPSDERNREEDSDKGEDLVPLMHQTDRFGYYAGETFQLLEMPYLESSLAFLIALPNTPDGLPALEATLSGDLLRGWMNLTRPQDVRVSLPRFTLSGEFGLAPALNAIGVRKLFSDEADLSGMDGSRELHVQSVVHKAWIAVDEEGAEAAAATGVSVGVRSMPAPTPVFRADHPFLFIVVEREWKTILFMGRMLGP